MKPCNLPPGTDTMESLTQNNAVKSPNSDPTQPEPKACVYTVEEAAQMRTISLRSTYNLCHAATRSRDSKQARDSLRFVRFQTKLAVR